MLVPDDIESRKLFYKILNESLPLPKNITHREKTEIYDYTYGLAKRDPRKTTRMLINEESISESVYFLLSGSCKFYYFSAPHNQELVPFLKLSPCLLAEGRSCFRGIPARFSVEVFGNSLVYKLTKVEITEITTKYPAVNASIKLMVKQQINAFKNWKEEMYWKKSEIRFLALQEKQPRVLILFKKKDIAAHLGIKEQSFSRVLREIKKL